MPTLSLCMIVKNEENFLGQCLDSVKGLVDEIIIVDTGSADRTKEIAGRFTDKVFDFEWCDDFSAARTESLRHATGDWILVLDADEVIAKRDHDVIRKLIRDEKSIALNDTFWLTWFNLGSIHLIEGNIGSACDCLEKAKALNPRAVAVYGNLGVAYVKKKAYDRAIENFLKALELKPNDASAYKNLGLCYDEIGEHQKAYSCFKKAVELNPGYKETIKLH